MTVALSELLGTARVVSLPLTTRFRGIDTREALLLEGPAGWTEFSPFVEYDDAEAVAWLRAALDFGWREPLLPATAPTRIRVNATLPAVDGDSVATVLARFPGCRTVKVKVAQAGQELSDDVDRVSRARDYLGPDGRIRIDANGVWNLDEAEHAIHALAEFDLEYVEQPCATIDELAQIRKRVKYMGIPIAADESVRKEDDPIAVAKAKAADVLILKAQPLGGIERALEIIEQAALPVVISSALDTSIGISMGAYLAASIPGGPTYDSGLGTAALLAADITEKPLLPTDGAIDVRRVDVSEKLLAQHSASKERTEWWTARLTRVHALL
jgi:O-succinylbenzoate synthase